METKVFNKVVDIAVDGEFYTGIELTANELGNGVILKSIYASVINNGGPIKQKKFEQFYFRLFSLDFFTFTNSSPVVTITANDAFNRNAYADFNLKVISGIELVFYGVCTSAALETVELSAILNFEVLGKMAQRLR